jgi:tRNA(Ile)-lysidine synthase
MIETSKSGARAGSEPVPEASRRLPHRPGARYTDQTVTWDSFLNHLRDWLQARELLAPDAHWVIGVSGGPDSTLLLNAMQALTEREGLAWKLHAAHFHHGLRGAEADADAEFAASLARDLNIPFTTEKDDIPARVKREGGSTEEVARTHRYLFLERVALRTGSDLVAVAHHADDNAETVLHRICRGTGLRGLAGIRPVRPLQPESHVQLVRPLIEMRRETIEALCQARGLKMRTDSMNLATEFTRGRIRHVVMPMLAEQLNPQVADALLRLAEHARWLGTYLEDAAARTFESLIVDASDHTLMLSTKTLRTKQRIIQAEVIRRAVSLVLGREQDLSFGHVDSVLRLLDSGASGKEVHVAGPVAVRKQYERLEFRPLTDAAPTPELGTTYVSVPGVTTLPELTATLSLEVHDVTADQIAELRYSRDSHEEWLDLDQVRPPLLVRGRQDGDRFHPLGAPGAKTIGDFFGDEKLDPHVRARTGILFDQDGPVWVMPLRIDERVKLRPDTKRALRLVLSQIAPRQAGSP